MTDNPVQKPENKEPSPDAEHQPLPPILRAELQIPQVIIDKYYSGQNKKERREWCRFYTEILTLLVIFCYTTFAGYQYNEMRKATKAAETNAAAALIAANAARDTLDVTVKNFRVDQRAWVGPVQMFPAEYIDGDKKTYVKEGQPVKSGVTIMNSGKTPARKLGVAAFMTTLKAGEKLIPEYNVRTATIAHSNVVMQPGTQGQISSSLKSFTLKNLPRIQIGPTDVTIIGKVQPTVGDTIVSKTNVEDFISGRVIVYIYGRITYEDIFNRPHWTKFCMFLNPDLTTFSGCRTGNETDD